MIPPTDSHLLSKDLFAEVALVALPGAKQTGVKHELGRAVSELPEEIASKRVMIVDDESINVKLVRKVLREVGFHLFDEVTDPRLALARIQETPPDLILLDIMMPEVSGLELLEAVRAIPKWEHIPVIILTATSDRATKLEALELGATDLLAKPVDRAELIPRVKNAITMKSCLDRLSEQAEHLEREVRQRTQEVVASRFEVVQCLARAAEFHDDITGKHVVRVGRYAGIIGNQLGLDVNQVHLLELAAQLHDVGKIGVPSELLNKADALTDQEYQTIQQHCLIGKGMFERIDDSQCDTYRKHPLLKDYVVDGSQSPLIQMASRIALTHHEHFDGNGYPLGLSGEDIPLEGRITAVADVFDALTCRRPYKDAFPIEKSMKILEDGRGKHFDPNVLDAFFAGRDQIIDVHIRYAD